MAAAEPASRLHSHLSKAKPKQLQPANTRIEKTKAPMFTFRKHAHAFMSFMALAGLRSRPPVSKHTPLPTSVTRGRDAGSLPAGAHLRANRRAGSTQQATPAGLGFVMGSPKIPAAHLDGQGCWHACGWSPS